MQPQVGQSVEFSIVSGGKLSQKRTIKATNADGSLHCTRTIINELSPNREIDEPTVTADFWRMLCDRPDSKFTRGNE